MRIFLIVGVFYFLTFSVGNAQNCAQVKRDLAQCQLRIHELIDRIGQLKKDSTDLKKKGYKLMKKNLQWERTFRNVQEEIDGEKKINQSLRAKIAPLNGKIDSLRIVANILQNEKNDLAATINTLEEMAILQDEIIEEYSIKERSDRMIISHLKKESNRRSLRVDSFLVTINSEGGNLNIEFKLVDSDGKIPSVDTCDLIVKIYPLSNKGMVPKSNDGALEIGAAHLSGTPNERKLMGKDISKPPFNTSWTHAKVFTKRYIKKLNYQIRVYYADERDNRTNIGMYSITKNNLIK